MNAIYHPEYSQSLSPHCVTGDRRSEKGPRCYCVADANAVGQKHGVLVPWMRTEGSR